MVRLRDLTGRGIDAVFGRHPDPAQRVSLDHECFVIGLRVSVRVSASQHGVDNAQHLAGCDDGGALVALAHSRRVLVAAEPAVASSRSGLDAFDEYGVEGGVSSACTSTAALPGALVAAWTEPGSDGAVTLRGEHRHVGTEN